MLYDQDVNEIQKAAKSALENCIGFNNAIDPGRLISAVSEAIAKAIKQYDEIRR